MGCAVRCAVQSGEVTSCKSSKGHVGKMAIKMFTMELIKRLLSLFVASAMASNLPPQESE